MRRIKFRSDSFGGGMASDTFCLGIYETQWWQITRSHKRAVDVGLNPRNMT
jgi:hypothetical protein